MSTESKTFCILPFVHLYLQPSGEMKPCCIADGFDDPVNLKNATIEEAFNSPQMKALRKDMLEGKRNKVCDVCYKKEDASGHSPRLDFNDNKIWIVPDIEEDYSVSSQFQHLDVRFSNLCNYKCRMCNHDFSSNWYDDYKIIKPFQIEGLSKVLKISETISEDLSKHLENVKSIYFAGGEPMIMPEHYVTLRRLYDVIPVNEKSLRRKVSIHYNTNLSILKFEEHNLPELWEGFERVFLSISCDGIGEVGEYQRTGFKHDAFIKNLDIVKKYFYVGNSNGIGDGMWYNFQYTTTIWNVYHIFDFINFMKDNDYIKTTDSIDFYFSWQPNYSSLNNLTESEKHRLIWFLYDGMKKTTLAEKTYRELDRIIDFIKSPIVGDLKELLDYTDSLDKMYGTDVMKLGGVDFDKMRLELEK